MAITRPVARFLINGACHDGCSVGPARTGVDQYRLIHSDIEAGWADMSVAERANARGVAITDGSVNRHRKRHLTFADASIERADFADLSELEALDMAIKQGQKNINTWKMTPSEWMKALELKLRLTEGSDFVGFQSAMASANAEVMSGEPTGGGVRPEDVDGSSEAA